MDLFNQNNPDVLEYFETDAAVGDIDKVKHNLKSASRVLEQRLKSKLSYLESMNQAFVDDFNKVIVSEEEIQELRKKLLRFIKDSPFDEEDQVGIAHRIKELNQFELDLLKDKSDE